MADFSDLGYFSGHAFSKTKSAFLGSLKKPVHGFILGANVLKLEYFDFVYLHFPWVFLTLFVYIYIR